MDMTEYLFKQFWVYNQSIPNAHVEWKGFVIESDPNINIFNIISQITEWYDVIQGANNILSVTPEVEMSDFHLWCVWIHIHNAHQFTKIFAHNTQK